MFHTFCTKTNPENPGYSCERRNELDEDISELGRICGFALRGKGREGAGGA